MPKKILNIPEHKTVASTPSTPDPGYSKLYVKSDGNWYSLDSSGNEILISAGSSSLSFRHDLQDPYSYCGSAPSGTLITSPVWEIVRITLSLDGSTVVETATGAWFDRYILTYS